MDRCRPPLLGAACLTPLRCAAILRSPSSGVQVICSSCNTVNEAGRKFCRECGARLAVSCPSCGSPNSPGTRFCGECGALLTDGPGRRRRWPAAGDPAASDPAASNAATSHDQAERRLVSVLFADLVGFTTLSEGRDAEAVRELLTRYFESRASVIERYGGTVEKFIGDAVMAVWGAPIAHEDDAERAVRAGARAGGRGRGRSAPGRTPTWRACRRADRRGGGHASARPTRAWSPATSSTRPAGCSRSRAPGTVLVGEATYRAAAAPSRSRRPATDAQGQGRAGRRLAGAARRRRARRRRSERAARGAVRRPRRRAAPAQGPVPRDRARGAPAAAGLDHRARPASARAGSPGSSRSTSTASSRPSTGTTAARPPTARGSASGRSARWSAAGPASPRARTTRPRRASSRATARRVRARRGRAALDRAAPAGRCSGSRSAGASRSARSSSRAWRTFFERIAERGTVVLVFEDLQWADAGLLDFIDHLLDWSRQPPLFVVTLARPELLERRPDWGAGRRNFTSLALEPLRRRRDARAARRAGPGPAGSACDAILERAEGIPLYAVETVRMLLDRGPLERVGRQLPAASATCSDARRPRDAAGADRLAPRRPRPGGPGAAPGRIGPGQDVHARGAGGGVSGEDADALTRGSLAWSGASC